MMNMSTCSKANELDLECFTPPEAWAHGLLPPYEFDPLFSYKTGDIARFELLLHHI